MQSSKLFKPFNAIVVQVLEKMKMEFLKMKKTLMKLLKM